jgi:integrase/recombinase XerD
MRLGDAVKQYVVHKKSLGMRFTSESDILTAFCRRVGAHLELADISTDRIADFLAGKGPVTRTWFHKHAALRGFYGFAMARAYVRSVPLPRHLPRAPQPFVPYVFTREELRRLLDAVNCYQKRTSPFQPPTFRALLLLLYGAGLRLSEALSLTLQDVDLSAGLLTIRDTKFYKTRTVALSPPLQEVLTQYAGRRQQEGHSANPETPFFVTRQGQRVERRVVERAFAGLRRQAGVYRTDGAEQPRLHDLRHSFAVHRVVAWYREGAHVQDWLPKLATYLGHLDIGSTQRYLTMTPELLEEASRRFARYAWPEVIHE